jgi:hypothetical protein
MANLSSAECKAGVSRKALDILQHRNGSNGAAVARSPVHSSGQPLRDRPPEPEKVTILETWNRSLDVINLNGFSFVLRDTVHISDRPAATYLYLNRIELSKLVQKVSQLLAETPERIEE